MRWWDRRTCQATRKMSFDKPITSMELSLQTQRLVVTSGNTVAFIPAQPAETGTPIHSVKLLYAPSSASVHPIWKDRFVTGSTSDEWVRVHWINGDESEVLKGHHGPVHCVEYSPDGEVYASGSGVCNCVHLPAHTLTDNFCSPTFVTPGSLRGRYDSHVGDWPTRAHSCLSRNHPVVADHTREDIWSLART
jgi:WD40 repeat protein